MLLSVGVCALCPVSLSEGVMNRSLVSDCGISWSYAKNTARTICQLDLSLYLGNW